MIMHPNADLLSTTELNYEQWRDLLRPDWGFYGSVSDRAIEVGRVKRH